MKRRMAVRILVTMTAALILAIAPGAANGQNLGRSIKVQRLEFPVSLSTGPATVVGYLYYHGSYENRPLQVLVHGATYNHTYWDFPTVNGETYSYARYMAAQKYAVLALDLPGTGESSKPSGAELRLPEIGSSIRQVIDSMRSGVNPVDHQFDSIVLVGHSSGAIAATFVQANWHSADALVVTASRHLVGDVLGLPVTQAILPQLFQLVAAFQGSPYFPLPDFARTGLFYYPPAADTDVIARDNATADQWTNGQLLTTFFAFLDPRIDQPNLVTAPVLIQLGTNDVLFPADLPAIERALWVGTSPEIQTLSGIGHDFNLHRNHEAGWRGIDSWIRQNVSPK
ncbi:MAG TPA: alpha/beta hydrolase [Vicinamibacterales bacterium]|nr:alpha/beta hydrolase [Vicinamibacterales bacterium]